jgi:hypothetical protein
MAHTCSSCGEVFDYRSELHVHQSLHGQEGPSFEEQQHEEELAWDQIANRRFRDRLRRLVRSLHEHWPFRRFTERDWVKWRHR